MIEFIDSRTVACEDELVLICLEVLYLDWLWTKDLYPGTARCLIYAVAVLRNGGNKNVLSYSCCFHQLE